MNEKKRPREEQMRKDVRELLDRLGRTLKAEAEERGLHNAKVALEKIAGLAIYAEAHAEEVPEDVQNLVWEGLRRVLTRWALGRWVV